jgi:hypothetical protein
MLGSPVELRERREKSATTGLFVFEDASQPCCPFVVGMEDASDQADRAISTGKLHASPRFHTRPINVVVFHGSDREISF